MRKPPFLIAVLLCSLLLNVILLTSLEKIRQSNFLSSSLKRGQTDTGQQQAAHLVTNSSNSIKGLGLNENLMQANEAQLSQEDINLLFKAREFDAAMSGYIWLLTEDPEQAKHLKKQWLPQVNSWVMQNNQPSLTNSFITAALAAQPNDIDFIDIKITHLINNGKVAIAIDWLYKRVSESSPSQQGIYVSVLQKLVKSQVDYLASQQAWQLLVELTQKLLWHEPQYPPYSLMAAKAHIQLQQYAQATSILQGIVYHEFYGNQAQQLLDKIALLDLQRTAIRLLPRRAHYLVDGKLNTKTPLRLMIDTGASLSVISASLLQSMNVYPEPVFVRNAVINTAGGKVNAPIYRFASYQIKDYRVNDIEFVVMDLDSSNDSGGLLGMNFLRQFVFQIDQKNNLLILSPNR